MERKAMSLRSIFALAAMLVIVWEFLQWNCTWNEFKNHRSTHGSTIAKDVADAAMEELGVISKQQEFAAANLRLTETLQTPSGMCACGCPQSKIDCHRGYDVSDILLSSELGDDNKLMQLTDKMYKERHQEALNFCKEGAEYTDTGGWCLEGNRKSSDFVQHGNIQFPIPSHHIAASQGIVVELVNLFRTENVTSVNDFGAGVGQYKAAVLKELPHVAYRAFDGAGNIENYTKGFVRYFDLTIPLALPKATWVLSLEVGEHVPAKFEGMLLRNLHHHNCRGVVLSWGVLGQGGHGHINNHANEYITSVFGKLGYVHDPVTQTRFRSANVYGWFKKSLMVFRRKEDAC